MGINRNRFSKKQDTEWVEWLRDEPLPMSPDNPPAQAATPQRSTQPVRVHQPKSVPSPQSDTDKATPAAVSINITVPRVKLPKIKMPPLATIRYWGGFTVILVGLSIGARQGLAVLQNRGGKDVQGTATTVSQKPTYDPALPEKTKDDITKKGTTYDPQRQLYGFQDKLLNAPLTVTQQPLPKDLKSDPDKLKNVASAIGATEKLDTVFGPAYIATSETGTSQRIVAIHKDLLMFIEARKKVDNDTWKYYLESFR